jgi:hypothetical protein
VNRVQQLNAPTAMEPFEIALQAFLFKLSPAESTLLRRATDSDSLLAKIKNLEHRHESQRITRNLLLEIDPFLRGIGLYERSLDIFSNVKPVVLLLPSSDADQET